MPQLIDGSAWPFDFKKVDTRILSQAEMNPEIVLRDVTASAPDFINLGERAGDALYARADRTSIGLGAYQFDADPMIAVLARHLEQ